MQSVAQKPTRRSPAFYQPEAYAVQQVAPLRFEATCEGETYTVRVAFGRFAYVTTAPDHDYLVTLWSACECPDAAHRAPAAGRRCKHVAAAEAVEAFIEAQKAPARPSAEERQAAAQRSIDATFACL